MRLLAGIRDQLEKLQTADEKSRAELKVYYERASKGSVGAEQAVLASRENESAAVETLRSRILSLQRYLNDTSRLEDPEAHQLLETAVNIAVGYIAGYQNLRDSWPDSPPSSAPLVRYCAPGRSRAKSITPS